MRRLRFEIRQRGRPLPEIFVCWRSVVRLPGWCCRADEVKGGTASSAEPVEVETGQAASALSPVVLVGLVAVVPDGVDFPSHAAQEGDVSVLDEDAECLVRCSAHVFIALKDETSRKGFLAKEYPGSSAPCCRMAGSSPTTVWQTPERANGRTSDHERTFARWYERL